MLLDPVRRYLDAMSFFTCLVPARMYKGTAPALCVPWFYACGLTMGLVCALAGWLCLQLCQLMQPETCASALTWLLPGLGWLFCELLVSRGLHWDGLADMGDALGSGRQGDEFRAILKDSRLGTFGALALVAVFAAQLLGAGGAVLNGAWAALILAPAWSRGFCVLIFCLATPYATKGSLAGAFAGAGTRTNLFITLGAAVFTLAVLLAAGFSFPRLLVLAAVQALLLLRVLSWAKKHGGYSGDFMGCLIELSQALFLLTAL